jgi:uncharacterized phage-like protein YoqJ
METAIRTIAFTGHRHLDIREQRMLVPTLDRIIEDMIAHGAVCFRTGGALGFDTLAADAVLLYREKAPKIRLELILPHPAQAEAWGADDRQRYEEILQKADCIRYVSPFYYDGVLQARNRALLEGADACIAYLRTSHGGGAAYTSQLALRQGLAYYNLYDEISKG